MPDPRYTVAEVARLLATPERTIRQAIAAGHIPADRTTPRRTLIRWSDATEWQRTRTPEHRSAHAARAARARWTPSTRPEHNR